MTDSEQIVYISCVEEVRFSFVSHLSEALYQKGISDVIVDSKDLLSQEAQERVERARVAVMVLPGNRTVFLDKLKEVLKCQKNKDQVVVPVLYGEIPLQGEWRSALDSEGLSSVHRSSKECSDSKLVDEIVKDVYEKLFYMERIGIYSKLLEIESMVCKQPFGVRCVGIWGMPGIGKTTLAKAVFNQMLGDFDVYCFIEDHDRAIHEKGLYRLLEEQFSKKKPGAGGSITKLSLLSNKLNNKRVLVVLDDVRNPLIAEPLLGGFDWFGPESLIIITSRDKQVFRLCRVNQIYEVQGLNEKEALQLFLLSASIKDKEEQNLHHELSMKVIEYANGNPLAISIYGRELKRQRELSEMETSYDTLNDSEKNIFLELTRAPPIEVVDAIKSSYDTLNDSEKNIFLDIACFFNRENVNYVMKLLEGCGFFPHVGIDVLVGKCLLTVTENRVWMHNLIQDVGREIINDETVQIKSRSRLWKPRSVKDLLEDNEHKANVVPKRTIKRAKVTKEIEGIFLDTSNLSFDVKPTAFENMLNLRLLKIYCSNSEIHPVINFPNGSLRSLPNELRLLHWENYPAKDLPENFEPRHLVEINMPYSQLETLWGGTKNLEMLRTIRLCHSQQLVDVGDLSKAQNLEVIDLQGCTGLQSFPATGQLLHLRVVNLSGCRAIKSFPEIPPNIETLHLQGTGIIDLSLSIVKPNELINLLKEIPGLSDVSNLEQIDLRPLTSRMKMSTSNQDLGKLICLDLKDCSCLRSLPDMVNLELLRVLDLSGCSELEIIQGFPRNLKELNLAGTAVRKVPQLPQSLELFNAHGCVSLNSIRLDSKKLPMHYTFSNCFNLSPYMVIDFLEEALANVKHIPRERQQELNRAPAFSFCSVSHADQFSTLDLQPGSFVMTRLNPSWKNTVVGFAMLVEVAFSEDYCDATGFGIRCVCRWKNKEGHSQRIERNLQFWAPGKAVPKVQDDHVFVFVDVNMRPSTDEENDPNILADLVVFEFFPVEKQNNRRENSCAVTRCGVRVINAATSNTSLEDIPPVLSLDPMEDSGNEVEEELSVSYDGLMETDKALLLYIACLFNDGDVGSEASLIDSTELNVGFKVLADRSLISVSSNGEIVMHYLLPGSSKKIERLVENSMINARKDKVTHSEISGTSYSFDTSTTQSCISDSENPENWIRDLPYVPIDFPMAASSASSSVARPTPTRPQVFINFRGKDVRNGFISFLKPAMREANINVFVDSDEGVGTDLANLFVRIQESRVAVVIFSKGYTTSAWCLDELAKIKECIDQGGLNVIPIFYKLAPAVVRGLRGDFGDIFRALKRTHLHEPERTRKWEEALESIPKVKGMALSEESDRNEREFIYEAVMEIQRQLSQIAVGNPKTESNSQGGFLVPARRLDIADSDNPEKWTWSAIYDRPYKADIEIATMINTHNMIEITGDFHLRRLTPGTKYEVVFLVRLDDTSLGWKKEVTLNLKLQVMLDGSQLEQEKALCLDEYIGDDWVDIQVGKFEAPRKREEAKIFFSMHQYVDTDQKSGLMVKGVAIRPVQ